MLAQRIKRGEVKRRTNPRTYYRRKCPAPELLQGIRTCEDLAEGSDEGGRTGLLDTSFEQVGRLEESGRQAASRETGEEVESCEQALALMDWGKLMEMVMVNECT